MTSGTNVSKVFRESALGLLTNPRREFFNVIEDLAAVAHFVEDLALRVHHRGVVTAERLADLGQGEVGEFAAEVHGDLAGLG